MHTIISNELFKMTNEHCLVGTLVISKENRCRDAILSVNNKYRHLL